MTDSDFEGASSEMGASPLDVRDDGRRHLEKLTKRLFDLIFTVVAILAFSLPMLAICIALKFITRGPILFCHERIGAGGKTFRCMKFRTMVIDAQQQLEELLLRDPAAAAEFAETRKLKKDPRIIPVVGHILRKSSFDELPQFFNVLFGHMSIVGPRPVPIDEFQEHYGENHPYTQVKPGITGLWQVSGRNNVSYADRVRMDREYVSHWSIFFDIQIIFKTIIMVCLDRNGY